MSGLEERRRAFTLAALATSFPTEVWAEIAASLREELRGHPGLGPSLRRLDSGLEALRADHLHCFDTGPRRVPLYETEYGRMRGLSKGRDLADVMGFYAAFGLNLADAGEMPDHLAVELEFYALLLHKQLLLAQDPEGSAVVEDARRKFLCDHLGSFAAAVAARPGVAEDPCYGPLLAWVAGLVDAECAALDLRPAPLDFFADGQAAEEMACGACVSLPDPRAQT